MLKLLGAQKQLYREAKNYQGIILLAAFIASMVYPAVHHYYPNVENYIIIGGALLLGIAELWLKNIPENKAKMAATIQEEFDTRLYEIPWNKELIGSKIDPLEIDRAYAALPNSKSENVRAANPWYSDYRSKKKELAILLCQKENLWWDQKQKKRYARFITFLIIISLFISWIVGFHLWELEEKEYLIQVLVPLAPFLYLLYDSIRKIRNSSVLLQNTLDRVNELREDFLTSGRSISTQDLRRIQNKIYENRRDGDLIPEGFYDFWRKQFLQKS